MRRAVARFSTWWLRLFALSAVSLPLLGRSGWVYLAAMAVMLGLATVRPPWDTEYEPVVVEPPVRGRWAALNSPATKVPSHGTRSYGQTYAIDLLHPRPPGTPTTIGWGLGMRPAEQFSSFGEPVHAVADGVVVAAAHRHRDHRSRLTWPSLLYLMIVEGFLRDIGGPRFVVGNHVVIDHGEGCFSAYGHLRRGSLRVTLGDNVRIGQQIGEVGNSGNSSEPHLHIQLMDRKTFTAAAGLPFRWRNIVLDAETDPTIASAPPPTATPGLPANGQIFARR